jgi:hypothetical protein
MLLSFVFLLYLNIHIHNVLPSWMIKFKLSNTDPQIKHSDDAIIFSSLNILYNC